MQFQGQTFNRAFKMLSYEVCVFDVKFMISHCLTIVINMLGDFLTCCSKRHYYL